MCDEQRDGPEECCPNCGQAHKPGGVFHDIGRCQSCGDGTDEEDELC